VLQSCRPGGCLAAARRLQQQGKIDWVGFSGHGDLGIILKTIEHQEDNGFDYVNLHWYTVYQRNSLALAAAAERDMGVLIISPTDKGGMLQKPPQKLVQICAPFSPIQFNGLFCLQRPEIHTISVGASCPADFDDHVNALALLEQHELVRSIYRKWTELMEARTGFPLPDALWNKFPGWEQTPGYMNIGLMLWLYNLVLGWDLLEFARRRYDKLGRDMPWVPGNNAAAADQYDLSRIAQQAGLSPDKLTKMLSKVHALLGEQKTVL